jgi:hypothetical protein
MAKRPPAAQSEHDRVIAAREAQWREYKPCSQTWTNPDGEQNAKCKPNGAEQYPDIIVKLRDDKGIRYGLEEVETADSVSDSEVRQWRDYAALKMAFLNLVVPADKVSDAKRLGKGIAGLVVGYRRTEAGYSFMKGETP